MMSTLHRALHQGTAGERAAVAVLVAGYPLLLVAAVLSHLELFVLALVPTYACDLFLQQQRSRFVVLLRKARTGVSVRTLMRLTLLLLLSARLGADDATWFSSVALTLAALFCLLTVQAVCAREIRRRRTLPVVTRNIDLPLHIPDAPPAWLTKPTGLAVQCTELPVAAEIVLTSTTHAAFLPGLAAMSLLPALACTLATAYYGSRRGLAPTRDTVLAATDEWLRTYKPAVVLYFSGAKASAYQVNMWLTAVERLNTRAILVLRERAVLRRLAPTALPVLCVPGATHLMNLDLSSVGVALYPANVGKNIHLLREPGMRHVFIGHGDSDKTASVNPYSKVYDQVWTAGPAGRERYALAGVGVRDENIVEVGRPQVADVDVVGAPTPRSTPVRTVLYAPTWEGWDDNPANTSLVLAGENIIRALLSASQPIRVLYRPHPFTGTRSPQAKEAHRRILALIEESTLQGAEGLHQDTEQVLARNRMAEAEAAMATLRARRRGDEAQQTGAGLAGTGDVLRLRELRQEWESAYWRSQPPWQHRVISPEGPSLTSCFNESDALVSDLSSVVSDFIASGKPYALTNSAGLASQEFRSRHSVARAATVLENDAIQLPAFLASLESPAPDHLAEARECLRVYLLGEEPTRAHQRFEAAVLALSLPAAHPMSAPGTHS
ncbi:hypothetical protein AB0M94_36550 [Streptomyces xanthochromogenes]|uniref:hypothetical protein n=1 Tax=Streptomyces xanthochromogenes TaxID=67384 RepID=UPI00341511D3